LLNSETGQALFKKCNAGNEVCSLDISGVTTDWQIYVNITTLDHFAKQNHLSKIDIIKIDTEGYDPLVFRGAKRLLQEHRIRLFIFEHLKGS
jgi:FkbM family methyltransferase